MRQPLWWNDWKSRHSPAPMKSSSRSRMHPACVSLCRVVTKARTAFSALRSDDGGVSSGRHLRCGSTALTPQIAASNARVTQVREATLTFATHGDGAANLAVETLAHREISPRPCARARLREEVEGYTSLAPVRSVTRRRCSCSSIPTANSWTPFTLQQPRAAHPPRWLDSAHPQPRLADGPLGPGRGGSERRVPTAADAHHPGRRCS
jgi:hypothetical protein